jgi:hypothetical protein
MENEMERDGSTQVREDTRMHTNGRTKSEFREISKIIFSFLTACSLGGASFEVTADILTVENGRTTRKPVFLSFIFDNRFIRNIRIHTLRLHDNTTQTTIMFCLDFQPWRWRQYIPPKHWYAHKRLNSATIQKGWRYTNNRAVRQKNMVMSPPAGPEQNPKDHISYLLP